LPPGRRRGVRPVLPPYSWFPLLQLVRCDADILINRWVIGVSRASGVSLSSSYFSMERARAIDLA
ncbi:hypothetical protein, partial [Burkholderia pseudomallei]|uniref:hypothetical protein n=1 Tax=Burkholderia pseudomallei TaxID=28450 RepID=UPI001C3E7963